MMEEKIAVLEAQSKAYEQRIDALLRDQVELRIQMAEIAVTNKELIKKLDGFTSGINRGLWIIGGGFLVALVSWITAGGLSPK